MPDLDDPGRPSGDGPATGAPAVSEPVETPRARLHWRLCVIVIALDQATKAMVAMRLPLYDSVPVIPGLLNIVHVENAGVAFGMLTGLGAAYRGALTMSLAMVALIGIAYYARQLRHDEWLARIGLSLILGGAIGNLIDRARAGHVLDFVDVYWGDWHFWAFNVADASISVGAVLVFADLLFVSRHASDPV